MPIFLRRDGKLSTFFALQEMPLFSSSKKNPQELVRALCEALIVISKEQQGKKSEKVSKKLHTFYCNSPRSNYQVDWTMYLEGIQEAYM